MYLIRLAFAAAVIGLKQEGQAGRNGGTGVAFIRGERTSVSAGNETFAKLRTPAPATYSSYQPSLHNTLRPPVVPNALAVVAEDENRIYIPSLAPR